MAVELAPTAGALENAPEQRRSLVDLYRLRVRGLLFGFGYLALLVLVAWGWRHRLEQPLTAESGAGYALGIIGGTLMLLLLLYPLRKHARFMRNWGPVRVWFRTHMVFGLAGPVCILFHSGFGLGSLNSNIALFCMLLVAGSGLVGRYFYTRIHHGLYGRKATLEELGRHVRLLGESLARRLEDFPAIQERIAAFEARAACRPRGVLDSLWKALTLGFGTWTLYLQLWMRCPASLSGEQRRSLLRHIGAQLESVRKLADFHFYERLFSLWHVLHFPLFLMLLISGIVHVMAVHMY